MYGDEETGIPPARLYTEPYALKAFESCRYVYRTVVRLPQEYEGLTR